MFVSTVGMMPLTNIESTKIMSRLAPDLPLLRPLPSSPDLQMSQYPNLFQTVPSFQHEAMVQSDLVSFYRTQLLNLFL